MAFKVYSDQATTDTANRARSAADSRVGSRATASCTFCNSAALPCSSSKREGFRACLPLLDLWCMSCRLWDPRVMLAPPPVEQERMLQAASHHQIAVLHPCHQAPSVWGQARRTAAEGTPL